MVPAPLKSIGSYPRSTRLIYTLGSLAAQQLPKLFHSSSTNDPGDAHALPISKRTSTFDPHKTEDIVFAVLIPILVLLSGLFAGLTLGYMSLDETQLHVLSISGTPQQREYANKIRPIRGNGHLLLVTLLLANMIVNESLPVISDPVLGGGVQSVVVSTVLIVIFSEIIPQSLFTRHGLYLGAKMAGFTKILIYVLGIIAWPVAKLLEFVLGSHHGIIYRRAELKELIAMHSSMSPHGGDLKSDTVNIIGATLDLQEKTVEEAMTPIESVFMLSMDSKLDYELLKKIWLTGHSRVPVYEEVDVPVHADLPKERTQRVKKIVGILLVKQCVLLDPKDATPLRKIPLNKVPFVPKNESLLGILDRFQEGRSHMAIVSRFSMEKAKSVKKAVKRGLTQRLKEKVGMGDDSSDESDNSDNDKNSKNTQGSKGKVTTDGEETLKGDGSWEEQFAESKKNKRVGRSKKKGVRNDDVEMGVIECGENEKHGVESKSRRASFQLPIPGTSALEQSMPADAVLAKEGAKEFLQSLDPAVMPLGIITLEDVLEELIGEEIYDEFDKQGAQGDPYVHAQLTNLPTLVAPIPIVATASMATKNSTGQKSGSTTPILMPAALKQLHFLRPRSAPPIRRDEGGNADDSGAGSGPTANVIENRSTSALADGGFLSPDRADVVSDGKASSIAYTVSSGSVGGELKPRSGAPSVKGSRFKSSPLGEVEEDRKGSNEEGRIPSGKDKEGPDKEV